ncbi:MAG TPA: hypothetical protein ENI97_11250, partial [Gammaproteobacteria bacterium]|nr:hypothetical protein [Gammaproteobacteria bacterium]
MMFGKMVNGFFLLAMYFLLTGQAVSGPLDTLQPGHWYEASSNTLEDVSPTPFDSKVRGVIDAWSGAAYDTKRDRLIVWGGGHGDYWGNEVYVFDINTLAWDRLNDPYWPAKEFGWGVGESIHADGSPASRHTYDGLEYLPNQDRFWIMGGSRWRDGNGDQVTALFNFNSLSWERKADAPITANIGVATAYDPVSQQILLHAAGVLAKYDPASGSWSRLRQDGAINGMVGEVDPVNRKFVVVGKGNAYLYDISDLGNVTRSSLNAVGDKTMEGTVPGLAYDPATGKIVAWDGGADVFTLDLSVSPPVWSRITPASGNSVTPTAATKWGTYGRWRYVPSKGVFVGVNSSSGSVYFYKLSADAGSGGGGSTTPLPTISLNADTTTLPSGSSATLSWSVSDATSCSASGAWSGSKALSGSESTGALSASSTFTLTC